MAQSTRTARKSRSSRTSPTPDQHSKTRGWPATAAIAVLGLLLAAEVARITVAARLAPSDPLTAARIAPEIPPVLAATVMADIGAAAAAGTAPRPETLADLRQLAAIAPLRPEPFLVNAALAERAGDSARSVELLTQARLRSPRSAAARYLLADNLLRGGNVIGALREMAVVSRLLPGASVQLVPALAQYARTPGARDELAAVVRANPLLKRPLLNALAADPANAELALALAGRDLRSPDPKDKAWKSRLLQGVVARRDYPGAYALWRKLAGVPGGPAPLLYNGSFRQTEAPPPFDWTYASGRGGGVAEPANGRLRVLYYGREDLVLASQLLLLKPGAYRFQAPTSGTAAPDALSWKLTCAGSKKELMALNVGAAGRATFTVPPGCSAQRLALSGRSSDMPEDSDVLIGPIALAKVRP